MSQAAPSTVRRSKHPSHARRRSWRSSATSSSAGYLPVRLADRLPGALHRLQDNDRRPLPAMSKYGWGFITGTTWDPNTGRYGILPEIWGTLYSSLLALFIGTVFGLAVAIFLSERFLASFVFSAPEAVRPRSFTRSGANCRISSSTCSRTSSNCWPPFPAWSTGCGESSSSSP